MKFSFNTPVTSDRLQKIAQVFNPFSTPFLHKHLNHHSGSILDLGCGQGHSTQMLSFASRSNEVYGMDRSCDRITSAMDMFSRCIFVRHDLTKTPLPVNADLMFSRFILSHLPDPLRTVNRWFNELPSGGKMLIEEVESIETEINVFRKYLAVNRWLMTYRNADSFAGEILAGATYDRATVQVNECIPFPVSNYDAALMFSLNIAATWKRKGFANGILSSSEIKDISDKLKEMIASPDHDSNITWNMRRIVLHKPRRE